MDRQDSLEWQGWSRLRSEVHTGGGGGWAGDGAEGTLDGVWVGVSLCNVVGVAW